MFQPKAASDRGFSDKALGRDPEPCPPVNRPQRQGEKYCDPEGDEGVGALNHRPDVHAMRGQERLGYLRQRPEHQQDHLLQTYKIARVAMTLVRVEAAAKGRMASK